MRTLHRTALSVALTLAPVVGTGCASTTPQFAQSRTIQYQCQKMDGARLEESRGNLAEAKRRYEAVLKKDPQNPDCLHRLGVVCTRLNQHSAADFYYSQANALKPNDPEILSDMGYEAFLVKNYEVSERLLEQSVSLQDNDRRATTNLAIVRAWQGKDDASLATFRRVNGEAEALRNLAAIQIARGEKSKGIAGYELAGRIDLRESTSAPTVAVVSTDAAPLPPQEPVRTGPALNATPAALADTRAVIAEVQTQLAMSAGFELPPSPTDFNVAATTSTVTEKIEIPLPASIQLEGVPLPAGSAVPGANRTESFEVELSLPAPSPREVTRSLPTTIELPPALVIESDVMYQPIVTSPAEAVAKVTTAEDAKFVVPRQETATESHSIWRRSASSRIHNAGESVFSTGRAGIQQISASAELAVDQATVWNICLVTLFEEKRLIPAQSQYSTEYLSQTYRFSSAEAMARFNASPHVYAPAAGGLDVVAVKNERSVVQGSLVFAQWYQRKLYLFNSVEHAETFRKAPEQFAAGN